MHIIHPFPFFFFLFIFPLSDIRSFSPEQFSSQLSQFTQNVFCTRLLTLFFFYAHYLVSGKCHVVHSPVEVSTHQTTTRRGVRERQVTLLEGVFQAIHLIFCLKIWWSFPPKHLQTPNFKQNQVICFFGESALQRGLASSCSTFFLLVCTLFWGTYTLEFPSIFL